MNLTKRVIILNKLNSPTIAQAIFILKDEGDCEFSAVSEAEKIVSEYISGSFFNKKRTILPFFIVAGLILGIGITLLSIL